MADTVTRNTIPVLVVAAVGEAVREVGVGASVGGTAVAVAAGGAVAVGGVGVVVGAGSVLGVGSGVAVSVGSGVSEQLGPRDVRERRMVSIVKHSLRNHVDAALGDHVSDY